ncbi:MAG: energy-coupling factor transporter ATPase [Clostridia bacterium]|nr:energy-coupling factor transporter ATPase [Clostridia bacterium]MBR2177186.1 energy-coupling factor transporter ATPase [Clostridia bacterium]
MEEFIEVKDVYFQYEGTEGEDSSAFALNGVNMTINKGEFVAIVGHNGSGKSTLAKHFNSIYLPTTGDIFVDGINTKDDDRLFEIRKKVGLVLQNPDNQIVAGIVEEDVAFGCENIGIPSKEIRIRVDNALKAVDMYDYRTHSPDKLSGGQKQRIAIAGIIAMEPECIVLDEPTAMLDPQGRDEVIHTITELNRNMGITIILITHYMEEAVLADRVIVMDSGNVLTSGTPKEVFAQVELLKQRRLDVPQATELIYKLAGCGFELPKCVLNEEECVQALIKYCSLQKKNG